MSNGNPNNKSSSSSHFLAGLGSGILSAVLLQPADLLKTRVQQSGSSSLWTVIRDISHSPLPAKQLWRGTLPSTLRTGMGSALYFSTLNALRQHVARSRLLQPLSTTPNGVISNNTDNKNVSTTTSSSSSSSSSSLPRLSNLANLTTGAIARGSVGFVMMPITVLKVRFESNLYSYKTLWGACRDIFAKEGLRGFFAGFGATAVRDAPYAGLYVLFYEGSKKRLSSFVQQRQQSMLLPAVPVPGSAEMIAAAAEKTIEAGAAVAASAASKAIASTPSPPPLSMPSPPPGTNQQNNNGPTNRGETKDDSILLKGSQSATINFLSGAFAASLATALTNPFDAIKTRIQLLPDQYSNMYRAATLMVKNDGVRALFDGLALRMARKAMSSALAWTVYEEVIRRVERR